jgi:hypothetical protein
MTNFVAECSTLSRLSVVCSYFGPTVEKHTRPLIETIRLENYNGHSFAVVTNQKIAAVEYLGATSCPDGVAHLKIDKIPTVSDIADRVTIMVIPEISLSSMTFGHININDVVHWYDQTPLDEWRKWFIDPGDVNKGVMVWDLHQVDILFRSSPSGEIVFPQFIDSSKPVLLMDPKNSSWRGTFIPEEKTPVKPCILPDWLKT